MQALIEKDEPRLAYEFSVSEEAGDAALAAHGRKALYESLAIMLSTGPAVR